MRCRRRLAASFVITLIAAFFAMIAVPRSARATESDELLLTNPSTEKRGFVIQSIDTAITGYQQEGKGYQSKQGPLLGRGSERLTVFQPQLLVVARQHKRITHRLWFPLDVITSASANAIDNARKPPDVMSQASRVNQSMTFDWTATYTAPKMFAVSARNVVHAEENFRSWGTGIGATMALAEDNATISANANQIVDWFTRYDIIGKKIGRTSRSTTNGNVGFTQILTPTTIVHANYGVSGQYGEMSNTWNSVPATFERVMEHVPRHRIRHAIVARFAQWLPWDGALKGFYRFYGDGWGIVAHAVEGQLLQRLSPLLYVRGSYRFYTQTPAEFFTTLMRGPEPFFTADSDLGRFDSHTVGGKVTAEIPWVFQGGHIDVGYERYWRTDGLTVNVALWQAGARF